MLKNPKIYVKIECDMFSEQKMAFIFWWVPWRGVFVVKCENVFCVYRNEGVCDLDDISLDIQGKCTEWVYLDIALEKPEEYRKELRRKYE